MLGLGKGLQQLGLVVVTQSQTAGLVTKWRIALLQNTFWKPFSTTASVDKRIKDSRLRPRWKGIGSKNHTFEPRLPVRTLYEYTTDPILMPRNGGRGPNGRIYSFRKGGGFRKQYYMVDWVRGGTRHGEPLQERIVEFGKCDHRNAKIALVCSGEKKRWVIASANMKVGDYIKSTLMENVPNLKLYKEGDALPVSNLPQGAIVFCVQREPGKNARLACAAGTTAQVIRHVGGSTVIRLPSNQDIMIDSRCQGVLGKAGYDGITNEKKYKAGQNRWLGIRPRPGLFHKKDGRFGRKINPPKKMKNYVGAPPSIRIKKRRLFPDMV